MTAVGTWAFSIEARRTVPLDPHPTNETTFTEGAFNPVYYAAVTDPEPMPRRLVVDIANCNTCHNRLALHGGQRLNTVECVICHNPNESDAARRPEDQDPPESVDFKRMIHRIHTGEELAQIYTVYGFGGSVNNFNDVLFPGDLRDCTKCHLPGTQQVFEEPPPDLLATPTLRDWYCADAALRDGMPGLPQHPAGGRPRLHDDGALRRGLRGLPRRRRGVLGRRGSRSVGSGSEPLLPFREGVCEG